MLYNPSTKIDFGVHKGFKIFKIYRFDPTYLEWAIEFVSAFVINIEDFEELPEPTPYDGKAMSVYQIGDSEYGYCIDSCIHKAETYIKSGHKLKEVNFVFSEFSKGVLKQKKEGKYISPEYEKKKFKTIKIEDL